MPTTLRAGIGSLPPGGNVRRLSADRLSLDSAARMIRTSAMNHRHTQLAALGCSIAFIACSGRSLVIEAGIDATTDAAIDTIYIAPDAPHPPSGLPVIPIGLDAYRMWDRLPYIRVGTRTYMR